MQQLAWLLLGAWRENGIQQNKSIQAGQLYDSSSAWPACPPGKERKMRQMWHVHRQRHFPSSLTRSAAFATVLGAI
jgi:hypothetical protein